MEVDITKMRKGSRFNGRKIDYCPKCGRKGTVTKYKDGTMCYTHNGSLVDVCGLQMFEVHDSCLVKPYDWKMISV